MSEPIACPDCGGIDWQRSWSGRFTEDQYLTWQHYVAPTRQRYLLTFDNEDQFDADTTRWVCAYCGLDPGDEIQDQLENAW